MSIFSDSDLQDFSALATDLAMSWNAQITRPGTPTRDDHNGIIPGPYEPVGTSPCLVIDPGRPGFSPQEQAIADQYVNQIVKEIYMPRLTDVREDDELIITDPDSAASYKYRVAGLSGDNNFDVIRRLVGVQHG